MPRSFATTTLKTLSLTGALALLASPLMSQESQEGKPGQATPTVAVDPRIAYKKAMEDLIKSGLAEKALKEGAKVPDFTLPDAKGKPVSLSSLLAKGPVVLAFYRGGWCPFCNLELSSYQKALPEMKKLGASLVAVSPETPDHGATTAEKNALTYPVLSDSHLVASKRFGLVFTVPEAARPAYKQWGVDLAAYHGNTDWELPIPATYVIGQDGIIKLAYVNADYTHRLEPAKILEMLKFLQPAK